MNRTYPLTKVPRACGIYAIRADNKIYVGQSTRIDRRGCQHNKALAVGSHKNSLLNKIGHKRHSFRLQILEVCPAVICQNEAARSAWLDQKEDFWMAKLNAHYNRTWSNGSWIKRDRFGKIINYQVTRPKSSPRRRSTPAIDTGLGSVFIGSAVAFLLLLLGCALVEMWG